MGDLGGVCDHINVLCYHVHQRNNNYFLYWKGLGIINTVLFSAKIIHWYIVSKFVCNWGILCSTYVSWSSYKMYYRLDLSVNTRYEWTLFQTHDKKVVIAGKVWYATMTMIVWWVTLALWPSMPVPRGINWSTLDFDLTRLNNGFLYTYIKTC